MGKAVGEQGVNTGVGSEHFQCRAGGRITLKNAVQIFLEYGPEAGVGGEAGCHDDRFRHGEGS